MRNKAIVILSFILLAVFSVRVYGDIPQPERDALIELYNSTNGDSWKDNSGWKAEPLHTDGFAMPGTEEDWHGITLSGDHVTEISLVNNNLAGPIPPELGDLSNLATLDLGYNQLTGEIPVALGSLKETLTYLSLRDNQLSGEIPAALGNLENLTYLNLHINQLTKIPTELDKLTNLTYLNLHSNQLNGIPPGLEWGKLSKLEYLWLNNNPLACNIPPGLGNLSSLIDLDLNSCQLTGSIPQELENLTKLQELKLNKNHLTGSIPEELGNLSNLTKLYLQSNNLKGPIPTSLIYLTGLSETDIGYNALYTKNTGLITFLDTKDPDWKDTQTIAPEGVNAEAINSTTIKVSWTPILYTGDTGGYRVFYSTTQGGPYNTLFGTTADKTVSQMDVTDLSADITYYFVVQTWTDPHPNNNNPVESEYSEETEATPHGEKVSISGRVTWSGEGLSGVTLTFSDNEGGETIQDTTNSEGEYNLEVNWGRSGNVTPEKYGFTFEPVGHTGEYTEVTLNQTDQDYEATAVMPIISGRVATKEGVGVEGVTITFSNNGEIRTTSTDSDGKYSLGVTDGWSGTVEPSKYGFTFDPSSLNYGGVNSNLSDQDYTATSVLPVISGRVATKAGVGVEGVKMTFSNGGGTVTTNSSGNYSRTVNFGWFGEVEPRKDGYEFEPPSRPYKNVTSNMPNQDYEAKAKFPVISGRVATAAGDGVPGVTLTFSNGGGTATTNINGNYEHAVNFGWSGIVTPSKDGYEFEPPSRHYDENVNSDIPDQDYTAITALPVISGRVTISKGTGIEGILGVKLTFSPSPNGETAHTVEDGYYEKTVKKGWSGTVIPTKDGYSFLPPSQAYEDVQSNHAHQNYTATPVKYISGYVTTEAGEGVKDVEMIFKDEVGGGSETETTDSDGFYKHKVPDEWSGTVIPGKRGYRFSPESKEYKDVTSDLPKQDYTAAKILPVISGRVATKEGVGVEGVKMTFSDGGGTATTSSSGNYSHAVNYGWSGEVEPRKDRYDIKPDYHDAKYKNVISDKKNQNYTATLIIWKISGRVTDAYDIGVEDVTLYFSGDEVNYTTGPTGPDGEYSQEVDYDWSGTVTPSKDKSSFYPSKRDYPVLKENKSQQDYKLSVTLTLDISWDEEETLTMRLYYVKLNLKAKLIGNPNVQQYIIHRREDGGTYTEIMNYTVQVYKEEEVIEHIDKYLDKDKTYFYRVEARDGSGKVIGFLDEIRCKYNSQGG